MVEVKESLSSWPQLASSVTLGGALVADVARRLLLGQLTDLVHRGGVESLVREQLAGDFEELLTSLVGRQSHNAARLARRRSAADRREVERESTNHQSRPSRDSVRRST